MGFFERLFGTRTVQIDRRMNFPVVPGAKVIGMLSGSGEVDYPDDFQCMTTVKNVNDMGSAYLPDEEFGFRSGSAVRVIGKTRDGYVLKASDKGDPVFIVDKAKVEGLGFDPNKYNFEYPL